MYRVQERIERALAAPRPLANLRERAAAIAALDHFYAGTPRGPRRRRARQRRLHAFLRARLAAWEAEELGRTAAWHAVLAWIPRAWIPAEQVRAAILRGGRASAAQDVEVSLDLQPPGGAAWVRERTLEEWSRLRRSLDAGNPLPIDLIDAAGADDPRAGVTAVACGYELDAGGHLRLHLYRPGAGPVACHLELDLGAAELAGRLSGPAGCAGPVRGFRCHDYAPREPPCFGVWRILRALRLLRPVWRLRRSRALRALGPGAAAIVVSARARP